MVNTPVKVPAADKLSQYINCLMTNQTLLQDINRATTLYRQYPPNGRCWVDVKSNSNLNYSPGGIIIIYVHVRAMCDRVGYSGSNI